MSRSTLERRVEWVLALLALVLVALIVLAGSLDAQIVKVPPVRTVATLGACADGSPKLVYVTDGASAGDCATGGGSTEVLCGCQDGAWSAAAAGGAGTVTSVALSVPSIFSLSGSPITSSGTFTLGLANQAANRVFAGPATGADAAPTFRALVAADIPSPLTSSTSGNAGTATALAANGANCSAGSAPLGVDASGAAESCTDYAEAGSITTSGATMATSRLLGRTTASTGAVEEITVGSGLSLAGGELSASGSGTIGGTVGATDNAIPRADGTGGSTLQASGASIDDNGRITTGAGSNGGVAFGSTSRISDSNNDGRLDFFAGGSSRMDILNNGEIRMLSGNFKIREIGSDRYVGTNSEYFVFGGGNGSRWSTEGAGGAQQDFAWYTGDYTSPTRSRGLRVYRSVEVSTSGSGSPNAIGTDEPWRLWTNEGATAEAHLTMPSAVAGYSVGFCVQDADGIEITAAAGDTIRVAGAVTSAAGTAQSATIGDCLELIAINTTEWVATSYTGTWTLSP